MNKTIAYCALICLSAVLIVVAFVRPEFISDRNGFLANFVNHELLNVLGVILAITLASAAQIHLTLNGIEERVSDENTFNRTRTGIRQSVYWLIGLFLFALLVVIAKPVAATSDFLKALFNGTSVVVLVWNVLVLVSLTQAVFGIKPMIDEDDHDQ